MADLLFDRRTILDGLRRLAEHLAGTGPASVTLVGGSFMAVHGLRKSTADVDSILPIDDVVKAAVAAVAVDTGWESDWLNDHARAWRPATFDPGVATVVYQHAELTVRTPPPDIVFLMKLQASRPQDRADLIRLWPRCAFAGPEDVATQLQAAYPWDEPDPHLVRHVARLIAAADSVRAHRPGRAP